MGARGARPLTVGVLALQGDVTNHVEVLSSLGAVSRPVRAPGDLEGVDALVLPGGESTTMSLLLRSSRLVEPLGEQLRAGTPVLGTCAGLILLADEVLDGREDQVRFAAIDLTVRRNGFGRQVASFEQNLDVKGLDEPMHAVFIRAPRVERAGETVDVLAEVELDDGSRHPVVCSAGNVLVAAFHPELAGDGRLHELLLERARGG